MGWTRANAQEPREPWWFMAVYGKTTGISPLGFNVAYPHG